MASVPIEQRPLQIMPDGEIDPQYVPAVIGDPQRRQLFDAGELGARRRDALPRVPPVGDDDGVAAEEGGIIAPQRMRYRIDREARNRQRVLDDQFGLEAIFVAADQDEMPGIDEAVLFEPRAQVAP